MAGVVLPAGEGEVLFGGRIVIKAASEQLTLTESRFDSARDGAGPHFHRRHADSFYVLEGELGFLVGAEEHLLGPGGCVSIPAGVVHAFWSASPARFLNLHTPDAGFADNLRAIDRGEPGGFDSVDAQVGAGLGASGASLLEAGEGVRREIHNGFATTTIKCAELALTELALEPGFVGLERPPDDDRVDAFYVLDGEVVVALGEENVQVGAGSFIAAPVERAHALSTERSGSRLLHIQAPSSDLYGWLPEDG